MARKMPVTMLPISMPPRAFGPRVKPTSRGATTGINPGTIISRCAARVTRSTARPYSGWAMPSIRPLISRNWRRTSTTTWPAARPAASVVRDRAVGVDGDDDAGHRQHRHGGNRNPVKTDVAGRRLLIEKVRDQDAGADDEHRQRSADHADRLPGDDVGRMTRCRCAGDQPHRWIVGTRKEFGDGHQGDRDDHADYRGPEEIDTQADQE